METAISLIIIGITILVVIFIEKFVYNKPLTEKEVADYQLELNKMDSDAKANYGLTWKHDAWTELMKQRKESKAFNFIFSGIIIFAVFLYLACATNLLSPFNMCTMCMSSLLLICYGIIKLAESKKTALGILASIFIIGTIMMLIFDKLMASSPYSYFYFCGLILVLGLFSLFPKFKNA